MPQDEGWMLTLLPEGRDYLLPVNLRPLRSNLVLFEFEGRRLKFVI